MQISFEHKLLLDIEYPFKASHGLVHVFEWYNEIVATKKKIGFKVAFLKPLIQIKRCRISLPKVERKECESPFSMMYEVILPNKKGAESSKNWKSWDKLCSDYQRSARKRKVALNL